MNLKFARSQGELDPTAIKIRELVPTQSVGIQEGTLRVQGAERPTEHSTQSVERVPLPNSMAGALAPPISRFFRVGPDTVTDGIAML